MDKYYVCRLYNNELYKIAVEDNYYDAVITAAVYSQRHKWYVVVVHQTDVVYTSKP